jgi:hypothetical protein
MLSEIKAINTAYALNNMFYIRFEEHTAVTTKIDIISLVTPCSPAEVTCN